MLGNEFKVIQSSEISAVVEFGNTIDENINKKIRIFCKWLDENLFYGLVEYIPYFTSVSIIYDPMKLKSKEPFKYMEFKIKEIISNLDFSCEYEDHVVEIPVCYGNELGPDIEIVAQKNDITIEDVINIHSNGKYLVYMIGFAPGFPYLGGLSEKIFTPRRDTPTIETPGGWQIIGRTPFKLFDLNNKEKTILKCGDIAKFYPISYEEYMKLKEKIS